MWYPHQEYVHLFCDVTIVIANKAYCQGFYLIQDRDIT